jgi:uncharacterized phage protein gp47/JayE
MAINIPTLEELEEKILNYYATEFNISVDELGETIIVESKVIAAVLYPFYLTSGQVENNVFPDKADTETLIRFGQGLLGRTPAPAQQGEYTIEVKGTIGAVIPGGTRFQSNDDSNAPQYLFIVDSDFTLSAATDSTTIRALTAGLESKLNVGDQLTSTQPLTNVNDEVTVTAITVNPSDGESIDSYKEDVLQAYRLEPQGGSPSDYQLWALDVPEVRTVYPYTRPNNVGSIDLYVEATPENSETIIGVPNQEILDNVYKKPSGGDQESGAVVFNETEQRGRKPMGIFDVASLPITPVSVDLEFTDLTNIAAKDSIQAAVEAYLYTIRPFIAGAQSLLDENDLLTIGQLISIVVTVLNETGGNFSDLEMKVDSTIVSSYKFTFGFIPYLRNINNNGLPI